MHLNFTANSFVFGHINRKYVPRTFSVNLASENFENASELHGKQLRFWTLEFSEPCTQRSSKIRVNFTENSYVPGCINRENASRIFS